jgi:hypothetical protein
MKAIKDFYKEIKNHEDGEIFLKNNGSPCVVPGQKLEAPGMVAVVTEVRYNIDRHGIFVTIDAGQTINRAALVKMIEAGQIKEV